VTATAENPSAPAGASLGPATAQLPDGPLGRAAGIELLGEVPGSGYRAGAALVRRADGQMVQLGPLQYALLQCVDGSRDATAVAEAMSNVLQRRVREEHVERIAGKLAEQGLLAGTEQAAPPRRNPLLALRWRVLVTNPRITGWVTRPFVFLFRPWIMWPVLAAFVAVFWFVLIHKGVASATAQAFNNPGLLLLVFALAVISAGFHELGHAAACRYGGATPGGMGVGLYLVWPAFYTDVTDAYRLDRKSRLRVDLAGLYFNTFVAVATMVVWLFVRTDALLLLVAVQILQMVRQLSPVIRADGYHILADATGVPDLYAHLGPTIRRLIPGQPRQPSALSGQARALVTVWVLVIVPVLASLLLGAVLLLPHLAASAWHSGRQVGDGMPTALSRGDVIGFLASLLRLIALVLPLAGSVLVTQKFLRTLIRKSMAWSQGQPTRRLLVTALATGAVAALAWAWWPSGQYQPVTPTEGGTLAQLVGTVEHPASVARPQVLPAPPHLLPGTHLAMAMIPVGGATQAHPALFVLPGPKGQPPVGVLTDSAPDPSSAPVLEPSGSPTDASSDGPGGGTYGLGSTDAGSAGSSSPSSPSASRTSLSNTSSSGFSGAGVIGAGTVTTVPLHTSVIRGDGGQRTTITSGGATSGRSATDAAAFSFTIPSSLGPEQTQARAINTTNAGTTYDVAYSLVTVRGGAPVKESNSAYAFASCQACTTVAVSFQVVLVVGQSHIITPINEAGALNQDCPACTTTAIADQMVLTVKSQPSAALERSIEQSLQQLDALPLLGSSGTAQAVASEIATVQQEVEAELVASGLLVAPPASTTTTAAADGTSSTNSTTSTTAGESTSTTVGSDSTTASSAASSDSSGTGTQSSSTSSGSTATSIPSGTVQTSASTTTTTMAPAATTTTTAG
jgi:putative peptide zinc metalloprotease protein